MFANKHRHVEQAKRRRDISLILLLLFFCTPSIASENDTILIKEIIIPANELYRNTFSIEHVRHQRLEHTDTTELELITLETPVFSMPAKNFTVISRYGMRGRSMHTGIDLKQRPTDSIFAAFDGMIRMARWYSSYGNLIVIRHPNGLETVYSHLSEIHVEPFQMVKAGESIGLAGRTGRATTEHLHFEIRFFYEHFDPNLLIDFENECLRLEQITFINGKLVPETTENTEETPAELEPDVF
ncbi:MAG: M23 family metallopeptidase [Bacteroidales bacterium]|jgi:murein DD-endopeptidase MepM/ murein hydrolase activator NlpD|nr:M23 family metallopeptidase [Bacteroidales bacterium]